MERQNHSLVMAIGELLVDLFCTDINVDLAQGLHFVKQAGGAPANVCSAISKLGGQASFIGKVGQDPFGDSLKHALEAQNVDTSMLIQDSAAPTTLAFVSLKENGERDFVFNSGADRLITLEEIDLERIKRAKIVHFGSATALLGKPFLETYLSVMRIVKESGIFVSFDPNYRANLWQERIEEFVKLSKQAISMAEFVKVSEEELEIITDSTDHMKGINKLHAIGAKVVAVTLGVKGASISNGQKAILVESLKVNCVDSTGVGDAFVGAVLYQMAQVEKPENIINDINKLKEVILFANKVGAMVCTQIGAISSLPSFDDVLKAGR